jgi:hypothetical protein
MAVQITPNDQAMNVKINPGFFDKPQMEKLSSSSSSSSSYAPNIILGLKNKVAIPPSTNKPHDNNCSNSQDSQALSSSNTIFKPLPFHSHKDLALAERSIKKLVEDSRFFPQEAAREDWFHRSSNTRECRVKTLYEHELQVGRMLGRGGFCQVRLASLISGKNTNSNNEYALKYLQPSNRSKSSFARGAADLAIEARFLSLLSNENIISLHYVSEGTLAEAYNCLDVDTIQDVDYFNDQAQRQICSLRHFGYFLVLDYLRDTLLQRIQNLYIPSMISHGFSHPKAHHNKHKCDYGQQCGNTKNASLNKQEVQLHWWNKKIWQRSNENEKIAFLQESLRKRIKILRQVASALQYLHANGIIYRDGKSFLSRTDHSK